jgi:hypothetical protein
VARARREDVRGELRHRVVNGGLEPGAACRIACQPSGKAIVTPAEPTRAEGAPAASTSARSATLMRRRRRPSHESLAENPGYTGNPARP